MPEDYSDFSPFCGKVCVADLVTRILKQSYPPEAEDRIVPSRAIPFMEPELSRFNLDSPGVKAVLHRLNRCLESPTSLLAYQAVAKYLMAK